MDRFARLFAVATALIGIVMVSSYAPSARTCADLTTQVWDSGRSVSVGDYAECVATRVWS